MASIKQYDNLIDTYFYWNAWNTDESFDLKSLKDTQNEELSRIQVVEILFEADSKDEDLFVSYESFLNKYFAQPDIPSYLFVCEFTQKQKSKLRSYKGFVKKEIEISSDYYLEKEIDLSDDYSIFGALIEINRNTVSLIPNYFFSNTNSFIIHFNKLFESRESFIREIIIEYVRSDEDNVYINYAKLILDFCSAENCVIYRTGGDGGTSEISLQAFANSKTKDLILLQAEQII